MGDKKVYTRLHVYDTSDWVGRRQYESGGDDTYSISIDEGPQQLKDELDKLLRSGKIFQKIVFTTHGNEGAIFFNHKQITWYELFKNFNAPHYERLFPFKNAKMYFDGCNVAAVMTAGSFWKRRAGHFFAMQEAMSWAGPPQGLGCPLLFRGSVATPSIYGAALGACWLRPMRLTADFT